MSIREIVLKQSPTITVTLGSDVTFYEDGAVVANQGVHLSDMTGSILDNKQITFKSKEPMMDPKTGKMGKAKRSFSIATPVAQADGSVIFSSVRVEFDVHHSLGNGTFEDMRYYAIQLLMPDSAADNFIRNGAKS